MKECPIIFSGNSVKAIMAGRKTQTRRVLSLPAWVHASDNGDDLSGESPMACHRDTGCLASINCPYGTAGDRLWVRERFLPRIGTGHDNVTIADAKYVCFEDGAQLFRDPREYFPWNLPNAPRWDGNRSKFRPAMFLPRWASRITLELTDIRVERLLSITEEDAISEGATLADNPDYDPDDPCEDEPQTHRAGFLESWDKINAKRGFQYHTNPWVWVLEFKRVEA